IQGVLAPGENILGAAPGGGVIRNSGTSYATPIVSGVVALLLSLQLKRGQRPNPQAVREIILDTALGCEYKKTAYCHRLVAGRLNVNGAASRIIWGDGAMLNPSEIEGTDPSPREGAESCPSAAEIPPPRLEAVARGSSGTRPSSGAPRPIDISG